MASTKSHPRPASVFTNEFDTRFLKGSADFVRSCLPTTQPAFRRFQALYGWERYIRRCREFVLRPAN